MNTTRQIMSIQMGHRIGTKVHRSDYEGYKTLRVVSNGLEGKVYGVGERLPGYEDRNRRNDDNQ